MGRGYGQRGDGKRGEGGGRRGERGREAGREGEGRGKLGERGREVGREGEAGIGYPLSTPTPFPNLKGGSKGTLQRQSAVIGYEMISLP